MISYKPFWKTLKKANISQYQLQAQGISHSTLTRLKRDENVSTDTINKLCSILDCEVGDIMEFVKNK